MAYVDKFLELSDAQALTASADSTNVVDLGVAGQVIGVEPMCVEFSVDVDADFTTGDETYTFNLSTGSATTLGTTVVSKAVTAATLVAGYKFVISFDHTALSRYVGVEYVLAGTTPSVTITASIKPLNMSDVRVNYASGYTIA